MAGGILGWQWEHAPGAARDEHHTLAGKGAGRLAASLLRYEEAKFFLEPLHARDTTDTEISYYLGIAYEGLNDLEHARGASRG